MHRRLKYDEAHWTREGDVEKGLRQYLELAGRAFNRTKFELFERLAGDVKGKKILDYGAGAGVMSVPIYTPSMIKERLSKAGYRADKWAGVYIIPYNILSWLSLCKIDLTLPGIRRFDLLFGRLFPFNRLGWSVIVRAEKTA